MLKAQLALAVGQREEDPERAWLEAVSVREKLAALERFAFDDPLLAADIERFRDKLERQLLELTREMGDEMLAPLYSWVDLSTQWARLESDVEVAQTRATEARAARGVPPGPPLSAESDALDVLQTVEGQLAWWRSESPPPPPAKALVSWTRAGGDSLRALLSADPLAIAASGHASRPLVDAAGMRGLGDLRYPGSQIELVLTTGLAGFAALSLLFARASSWHSRPLDALAATMATLLFAALATSIASRRRGKAERRAGIAWVWHYTFFTEQAVALESEAGWLRALVVAFRARRAFEAHKGEGGQLIELAKWRPDLEPFVAEAVRTRIARGP